MSKFKTMLEIYDYLCESLTGKVDRVIDWDKEYISKSDLKDYLVKSDIVSMEEALGIITELEK